MGANYILWLSSAWFYSNLLLISDFPHSCSYIINAFLYHYSTQQQYEQHLGKTSLSSNWSDFSQIFHVPPQAWDVP